MANNLVTLLIKIHARICQNHMHANLRSYIGNASSCYVNMQRPLLYAQTVGFVLELVLSFMHYTNETIETT